MSRPSRRSMNTVWEDTAENGLDSTGGSGNILDDPKVKVTKRYRLFCELLETEANYVKVLTTIIENFKKPLCESDLLDTREMNQLFGKNRFEELRDVHAYILSSMEQLDRRWTEKALVGQVFATPLDDFRRCYIPYFNQYDSITETLREITTNDANVNQFLQELEAGAKEKKFKLIDLLIRPIQRLPSVSLILSALLKATSEKNPDRLWLMRAKEAIDTVLKESNHKRAEADQHANTIQMVNQIDRFPAELVNSKRPFESKADFRVLKGRGMFSGYKRWEITFFLFSSCITVAKRRQARMEGNGTPNSAHRMSTLSRTGTFNRSANVTMGTLQRTTSIMSIIKHRERKPYSHLETVRFPDIRELTFIRDEGIFFVRIRGQMTEDVNAFQIAGDTDVESAIAFFNDVCMMINNNSNRYLELVEVSDRLLEAEESGMEIDEDVVFMMKAKQAASDVQNGTLRPASTLRRAVSNVSIGLYRMASKTSLNMSRNSIIAEH